MSTENVRNNLADHLAIGHLLNQYTDALNVGDWTAMRGVFTRDAVWRVVTDGEVEHQYRGADTIAAFLKESAGLPQVIVQMNHAPVIHVDGDDARAHSTMEAVYWLRDGTRQQLFALYHDKVVREEDGEWRFVSREFRTKATVTATDQRP